MVPIEAEKILDLIGRFYGTTIDQLASSKRSVYLVNVRMVITVILRDDFDMSYPRIGAYLHRDHSTIISLYERSKEYPEEIERTREYINERIGKQSEDHSPGTNQSNVSRWRFVYDHFEGKCAICGYDDVVEVHHIIPKRSGGTDKLQNLLLLCPNHHAAWHAGQVFIKDINQHLKSRDIHLESPASNNSNN